jgi:hypothetical protein
MNYRALLLNSASKRKPIDESVWCRAEMEKIVKQFEKLSRDGFQLLKAEKATVKQAEQRVGPRPSLNDCVEGLQNLYIMHRDE